MRSLPVSTRETQNGIQSGTISTPEGVGRSHISPAYRVLVFFFAMSFLASCKDVNKITDAINNAIAQIHQMSDSWQETLTKLSKDLAEQGQHTIAIQVDQLVEKGIATTGKEFKCDADFVADRIVAGLERIRAGVNSAYPPARDEFFCQEIPLQIDLALKPEERNELRIHGYNLALKDIDVSVVDVKDERRAIPPDAHVVSVPDQYTLVVNLSETSGLPLSDTDKQLLFKLNDGQDHAINILARSRHFSIDPNPYLRKSVAGDESGGDTYPVDECTGGVAIGLHGRSGGSVDQLQLECAALNPDGSFGAISTTASRGGTGGEPFGQLCPPGMVLIGLGADTEDHYQRVGQLKGQCQLLSWVAMATGGNSSWIGGWGWWSGHHQDVPCVDGTNVVTGIVVRAGGGDGVGGGSTIKHLELICRKVISERVH